MIGARVLFNSSVWTVRAVVGRDPLVTDADAEVYRLEGETWAAPMRSSQQLVTYARASQWTVLMEAGG